MPLHPFSSRPESSDAAIVDEGARLDTARRPAATPDEPRPRQAAQPVVTNSSESEPNDAYQISTDPPAQTAPVPNLENNNAASNVEASPNDDSKASRITARVAQLKVLLREEDDQFSPHIKGLEDLEEFEEAMELLHLDEQLPDLSAGYPQTEDGFVAHCSALFDAMKNLENILDVVGVPGDSGQQTLTRSGDSIAVKFVKSKKPIEVNLVAGKLRRAMRKAQRGRLSVPGRKFYKYNTFTLRFQAVVDALTSREQVSKLLVRSAFESDEWIARIAIDPDAELHRKRTNKTINDAKTDKQKFAERMKRQDPTISFKDTVSPNASTAVPSPVVPSPVVQAQQQQQQQQQQQSDQGPAVSSPQAQMGPDSSPAPRPSKRVKTSQEQADQPETATTSSIYEGNNSQHQQPLEVHATDQGQQSLQAAEDGSLDDGFTEPGLSEEAIHWSMDDRSEQREPDFASAGMSQPSTTPIGGHGTAGHDVQAAYVQSGILNLDLNPFNSPGPIQQYGFELNGPADPGFHGQPPGGKTGSRAISPDDSQYQDEDRQS